MSFLNRASAAASSALKGRDKNKYGDLHFISLLGATLSRLAYLDDNLFLKNYMAIMGPVILPQFLTAINEVQSTNLLELLDDEKLFALGTGTDNPILFHENSSEGKKYVDFLGMNIPQDINIINKETGGTVTYGPTGEGTLPSPEQVKYISLGWSNYGEVYIVADKRMPNTLFILFRGTYSAKTAALYSKPTSAIPLTVCGNETFLYGIFKTASELIHTIIESARYLAVDFLEAKNPNSVKIFTTGHSLGGAMCTIFSYLWLDIKKTAPYNTVPYTVLADNIVCVSLGAPRCMGAKVAQKFCDNTLRPTNTKGKILFLRITTRGDPVTGLPLKQLGVTKWARGAYGFEHPCSTNDNDRRTVSEDCNAQLVMGRNFIAIGKNLFSSAKGAVADIKDQGNQLLVKAAEAHQKLLDNRKNRTIGTNKSGGSTNPAAPVKSTIDVNYEGLLDCTNYKTRTYIPNPLSHTIYLDILFINAVDIMNFMAGLNPFGGTTEVQRTPSGSTVCRVIIGIVGDFKVGFFDVGDARATPTGSSDVGEAGETAIAPPTSFSITMPKITMPKIGGDVKEDIKMTKEAFDKLVSKTVSLQGDLCPKTGDLITGIFTNEVMPDISKVNCPSPPDTGSTPAAEPGATSRFASIKSKLSSMKIPSIPSFGSMKIPFRTRSQGGKKIKKIKKTNKKVKRRRHTNKRTKITRKIQTRRIRRR